MEIQSFLKRVRFEFYLYSVIALLISLVVTGMLYGYHARLIAQQNSLQHLNQLLSKQLESVVLISDISQQIGSIKEPKALLTLQERMASELESLQNEHVDFFEAVNKIKNKKIREDLLALFSKESVGDKINGFLNRYKGIERVKVEDLKNIQYELSSISNLAYRDLFRTFMKASYHLRGEQFEYQSEIKNIGNYLIIFIIFVIFIFWGLLFHPIYKKLINEYEKKNQALANAQIASRAKNDFLANVNHEIRTPMMTILGYIELLSAKGLLGESEKEEAFKTINENASHLLKLIDEILDLSKLELGEFNVNLQKVDPKKILDELYNILVFKTEKKGIDFNFNFKTEIPEVVLSDPKRIKQALFNVLNNAVKFTLSGSIVMDIYYEEDSAVFTFIVKDTGEGIGEKSKEEIFKMFSQENTTYNRNYAGTGLGLALTKKILNELGGDIKLDFSEKGQGSVFSLWLKVRKVERIGKTAENMNKAEKEKLEGKKLLVVDDAVENSRIFQKYLAGAGSEVDVANNGAMALDMIENKNYDLVLLDIQMPEIDGYQVLKILREERKYSGL